MTLKQKYAYREAMREMAEESMTMFNHYQDEVNRLDKEIDEEWNKQVKNAERLFRRNKHGIN